jgi:hypothetical protein
MVVAQIRHKNMINKKNPVILEKTGIIDEKNSIT